MKGARLLMAFAVIAAPALADPTTPPAALADTQLRDPAREAQARALMETLRCVVCQGQSIADSDASMAGDMRALVRSRIAAGEKPAAIRAWLIERYGDYISYDPPLTMATWPLWLAPLALVLLGVKRRLWSMVGAALMLGAAGYAWQGSPTLPASGARTNLAVSADDPSLIALRESMLGRFTADSAYVIAADAMLRAGERRSAVRVLLGGLNRYNQSIMLWTALGSALASHDGNTVSPPALFAFQQAMRIAPLQPAPPFFLGLAYIRANDYRTAQRYWAKALALSPQGTSYRREIAMRLALLDRLLGDER